LELLMMGQKGFKVWAKIREKEVENLKLKQGYFVITNWEFQI